MSKYLQFGVTVSNILKIGGTLALGGKENVLSGAKLSWAWPDLVSLLPAGQVNVFGVLPSCSSCLLREGTTPSETH